MYPGVDLVFYGNQQSLEYDYVVAPGADPRAIRMQFSGISSLALDPSGNLILKTAAGPLVHHRPVIYQETAGGRRAVAGQFVIHPAQQVSFQLGPYDRSLPLVIDPTLSYSSFLGGSDDDNGNAVAADASGNMYFAGITFSTNDGDGDILLRKFAPDGSQVYLADYGGNGDDYGNGVRVDSSGSVYVGGRTDSTDFPAVNAFQSGNAGGIDAFAFSLNPAGTNPYFSTYVGGSDDDYGYGIALDSQGAAYLAGTTYSTNFPTSQGAYQVPNRGNTDAFVIKLNANGGRVYSTLVGGGSNDNAYAVAVDSNGNAFITGSTNSDSFPQVNNPFQHSRHSTGTGLDAFVTEINTSGTGLVYSTFLGGGGDEEGNAIAVDATGSAYITGRTASSDYPTTSGAYQTGFQGGDTDIFVTKMVVGQGGLSYSTFLGSHGADEGWGIAVDGAGAAYIAGDTDSDQYPVSSDAIQGSRRGSFDAVITKLNSAGNGIVFSTFLGGSGGDDIAYGIAVDSATNIYVAGVTSSNDFPVTSNAVQPTPGGGNTDAFFARIFFQSVSGSPIISNGGIVNGGSFATGPVSPGSVVSIFGNNFIGSAISASSVPLPTSLGGTSVLVNGVAAPLFYVGPQQINIQLPNGVPVGSASIQVQNTNGISGTASFSVAQAAPGLVVNNGRAIVVNQDGSINGAGNPARAGTTVVAYFTGVGPVSASLTNGAATPASPLPRASLPSTVTIGGTTVTASYVGLTPGSVGLAQANIVIPSVGTADFPLVITIGGVASNSALIAVSQ